MGKEKSTNKRSKTSKASILIVEDDASLLKILVKKITQEELNIDTAMDGETALKKILSGNYKLIVLDLGLPKINGFEILKAMKLHNIQIDVIVLSNLSQSEDIKKTNEYKINKFFTKSDTPLSVLINHMNNILA